MVSASTGVYNHSLERLHVGGVAPESAEFLSHTAEEVQEVLGTLDATDSHFKDRSLQILSFSSCVTLFTGVIASIKGIREYELGKGVKNLSTKMKGLFHLAAGASEVGAGGCYVGMSGATLSYFLTASMAAHVAAEHLEHLGSGLIGLSTLFYSVYWGIEMFDLAGCRIKIDDVLRLGKGAGGVVEMIREEIKNPSLHFLWEKGVGKEVLKEVMDLNNKEPEKVLKKIDEKLNFKIFRAMCYSLLSIGATITSMLILSSFSLVAPWVFTAVGAGLGIIWLFNDVMNLKESMREDKVMNWEKGWIYFSTLFCLAAVMGSLYTSQEVLTFALTLAVGLAIFIVHYCAIRKIHSNAPTHS